LCAAQKGSIRAAALEIDTTLAASRFNLRCIYCGMIVELIVREDPVVSILLVICLPLADSRSLPLLNRKCPSAVVPLRAMHLGLHRSRQVDCATLRLLQIDPQLRIV
jgi:hypothetical protein